MSARYPKTSRTTRLVAAVASALVTVVLFSAVMVGMTAGDREATMAAGTPAPAGMPVHPEASAHRPFARRTGPPLPAVGQATNLGGEPASVRRCL